MPGRYRSRRPARRPRWNRRRRFGNKMRRLGYRRRPQIYNFKRTVFYENSINVGSAVNFTTHYGFTLGQLPNATDFTNLYDQYRINKVVMKLIPKWTSTEQGIGIANYLTQIHTAIDYDDSLALPQATCLDDITQYQSHKMTPGNRMVTRVLVPKVELTGSSLQAPKARQWLDCDLTGGLHNGVKVVIPKVPNTTTLLCYDVQLTFYMSFKNVV